MKTKNLTIQEAIQSGRPYRRSKTSPFIKNYHPGNLIFSEADVLATDWEIKVEPKVIWVNEYPDGSTYVHKSEMSAISYIGGVTRKFVEVIE